MIDNRNNMKNDFLVMLFWVLLLITGCRTSKYSESRNFLKQYAFCRCLAFAYEDSVYFRKNDISEWVYRDIARYNGNVYDRIDSLSRIKARSIRPSIIADYEGKKAILLSCFEYYHSKILDSLVKTMDDQITK